MHLRLVLLTMTKMIPIGQVLTEAQIVAALRIWRRDRKVFHRRVADEIIRPALPEINRKLGQENSADYLAYALEYAFTMQRL